jgi:Tol biopolymer transport system component
MTYNDGFDRTVSEWLTDQAGHSRPDYLDEVLSRTTRTRQRPAWSSLERWLPVLSTTRFAPVPRMAWLLVVLGLVLALAATAVFIGSRTKPLPPPFGMTGNQTLLYSAADGDIYALDAATNEAHPLITGPTTDRLPSLSPDGTMVVFNRQESELVSSTAMVANADGSNIRVLSDRAHGLSWMAWSPDSARLAVVGTVDGVLGIWILAPDATPSLVTSQQEYPTVPAYFNEPLWRPNGHELVFLGNYMDNVSPVGLYLIQTDGKGLRTILEPTVPGLAQPALSPDGTRVAYSVLNGDQGELHVVNVDTGEDAVIPFTGTRSDLRPRWSPDGTRLAFERYKGDTYHIAVGSVDGGQVVEIGPAQPANTGGSEIRFSPDGTKVLAFYKSDSSSWILDPADGSEVRLSDEIASPLTWQEPATP